MNRSSSILSAISTDNDDEDEGVDAELRPLKRGHGERSPPTHKRSRSTSRSKPVSPDRSSDRPRKKPCKLIVDQPTTLNDNSIVTLHPDRLSELQLFRGDIVQIHGKLHHTAVAVGEMAMRSIP